MRLSVQPQNAERGHDLIGSPPGAHCPSTHTAGIVADLAKQKSFHPFERPSIEPGGLESVRSPEMWYAEQVATAEFWPSPGFPRVKQ